MDEFSRSPYSIAIPGFSSVGNWKIYVPCQCLAAVVDLEFWSVLSFEMIVNIPFLNVRAKNAPSLLYWDIIRFAMSLISLTKLMYGRDIPAQKYSQLSGDFDRLELYNLTATYNGNGDWVFLLCRLYEDIPLFLYCIWSCTWDG